ncbi:lipid droplet assembly factor 1 [Wolbachia endosymbiont of Chironomus riparius]|uniref:lipid droplet assembly factor 1 n=1 Tax=Wolbachia endosymbiont of Chironomus riparius TaxID=2883238 RepID=UPI00209EDB82|nr:lipid droplet assembly factor 1 [Wolbachia endosymbiont of Chironomus riparius]
MNQNLENEDKDSISYKSNEETTTPEKKSKDRTNALLFIGFSLLVSLIAITALVVTGMAAAIGTLPFIAGATVITLLSSALTYTASQNIRKESTYINSDDSVTEDTSKTPTINNNVEVGKDIVNTRNNEKTKQEQKSEEAPDTIESADKSRAIS